jgi:hypothetical protein
MSTDSRLGRRCFAIALLLGAVVATFPPVSDAKIPAQSLCTLPTLAVGSASGHAGEVRATLRDVANNPLYGTQFGLDFSATELRLFAVEDDGVTVNCAARTISAFTDPNGEVVIHPRFAGAASASGVRMFGDGVNLGTIAARSTDLDGLGGGTGLADFAEFTAGFGAVAPRAELNFDGSSSDVPDLSDFAIFARELAEAANTAYCP